MGIDPEFGIEQRVMISDARFQPFIVRARETARVRELQANEQVVVGGERLAMGLAASVEEFCQAGFIGGDGEGLVRISAAIGANGGGFATPDEFSAA